MVFKVCLTSLKQTLLYFKQVYYSLGGYILEPYKTLKLSKEESDLITILRHAELVDMAAVLIELGISGLAVGRSENNNIFKEILEDYNRARAKQNKNS